MHNASYNAVNYGLTYISCFSNVPVIRNAVKHYFRSVNRLKTANYYIFNIVAGFSRYHSAKSCPTDPPEALKHENLPEL